MTQTPWQDLISEAALEYTLKTGKGAKFELARKDLYSLCTEIGGVTELDLEQYQGYIALQAQVWCYPLRQKIIVNEWVKK